MKNRIKVLFIVMSLALLTACGAGSNTDKLVVGASPAPHAEILEYVKPLLEKEGIELEIIVYNDYIMPNKALDSGEIDANYFQHIPYFDIQKIEHDYDFVNLGGIHIEPMGIYSKRYKELEEVVDGAEVYISNSVADHGRVFMLLEKEGLIEIDANVKDKTMAEVSDIKSNPKNLKFISDFAPELLSQMYLNDEADLIVVNTNHAITAGLNPMKDSIALEDADSPYVNIVAVESEKAEDERLIKLIEVLNSEDVKSYILEKYEGVIVPV